MALAAFHVKVNVNCETWHLLGLTQGSSISVQFCKQEDNGLIGFRAHIYIFNIIIQSCSIFCETESGFVIGSSLAAGGISEIYLRFLTTFIIPV